MADFKDNSRLVLSKVDRATRAALEAIGAAAEAHAKESITKAPAVDTGRLRNSIAHKVQKDEVYIGTNVEYAIWHEVGTGIYAADGNGRKDPWLFKGRDGEWHRTHGVKPIHFLRKAAKNHTKEYKALVEDAFKDFR